MATIAKSLEDAAKELMKDYENATKTAAEYATKRVTNEFKKTAYNGLAKYYEFLSQKGRPSSYDRSYRLRHSIVPIQNVEYKKGVATCTMGVSFDSELLEGFYDDQPSRKYRGYAVPGCVIPNEVVPINVWIMNNFIEGIHPETKGSTDSETACAEYKKYTQQGYNLENRLNGLIEMTERKYFKQYFSESLFTQIIGKL